LRQGRCARTGAQLACWLDAKEGLLLRASLQYPQATRNEAVGRPMVRDAHAWLVARHVLPMAAETLRLRRLGWTVTPMDSCAQAQAALADEAHAHAHVDAHEQPAGAPDLLVVFAEDGLALADVLPLARAMPASTRCLVAVTSGHPWLGASDSLPGYELCIAPFSPSDLAGLCMHHLRDTADPADPADPTDAEVGEPGAAGGWAQDTLQAGLTRPAELRADERPRVLVVDDSAVNRLVGRGLVEVLGYAADSAHDGLDAIDSCRRRPPACVLMDVDMPVLGGIEATARLRDLQRAGELPFFPVIAATANDDYEAACRAAGMDGFLVKPLDLRLLRAMLRRFTDGVVVR
jgi:CheY-like chemotaxis protein